MKENSTLKKTYENFINKDKTKLIGILNYFPLITSQSKCLQHFLFHFPYFQLLAIFMSLQTTTPSTVRVGLAKNIQKFADIFVLNDILRNNYTDWIFSFFLICSWLYLFFILLVLGLLAMRAIKEVKFISLPRSFIEKLFRFHYTTFFWYVNMTLMTPFSSSNQSQVSSIGLKTMDTSLIFLNSVGILLNYVTGIILAVFCSEFFRSKGEYAIHTSYNQIIIFLSKAALGPLIMFLNKDEAGTIIFLNILCIVYLVFQLYILIKCVPYYSPRAMELAIIWNFVGLWILFANILGIIISDTSEENFKGNIYLKIIMMPLIIKFAKVIFDLLIKSVSSMKLSELTTEELVFKKLLCFTSMIQKMKIALNIDVTLHEYEIFFLGDLAVHSKTCKDDECICHTPREELCNEIKKNKTLKERLEIYKEKRAIEILSAGIEKLKNSQKLRLTYANTILQNEDVRLSSALTYIYSISSDNWNIFQLDIISKKHILLKIVEEKLDKFFNSKSEGVLNLKSFVDFQRAHINFKALLLSNTRKFRDFWLYYQEKNFKMVSLYKKSQEIEKESLKIERLWNSYMNQFPQFYHIMGDFYCAHQRIIRNLPSSANKISEKYAWKLRNLHTEDKKLSYITDENLNLPDTVTFYISMSMEKIGKIQYVSPNIEAVLGYISDELLGKNINTLISPSLGKEHDRILKQHLQQTKTLNGKNYYNVSGYVKNSKGYYSPMTIYITIFPYVQRELTYIGVLRMNETPYEHIILTDYGYVDGFSEKIGKQLDLPFERFTHISEICPDLLLNVSRKGGKLSRLRTNVLDDILEKSSSTSKRKSVTTISRFSRNEDNEILKETQWKLLPFINQKEDEGGELKREKEHRSISYKVKIKSIVYLQKKFYILLIRPISVQENSNTESSENYANGNNFTQSLGDNDPVIPLERPETIQESLKSPDSSYPRFFDHPLPSEQRIFMTDYPGETEAALLSSTARNKTRQFTILSPKAGESSEIFQLNQPQSPRSNWHERMYSEIDMSLLKKKSLFDQRVQTREELLNYNPQQHSKNRNSSLEMQNDIKERMKASEKASNVSSNSESQKIEQATYSIPKDVTNKNIGFVAILILLACIALLTGFVFYGDNMWWLMKGNIQILNLSGLRSNQIIFIYRYAEQLTLLRTGFIQNNRFTPAFGSKMPDSTQRNMLTDQRYLNNLNGRFRNQMNQTQSDLLREIHNWKFEMVLDDSYVLYRNNFDASIEIAMRALAVTKVPSILSKEDENINFLLRNSLNDLLITSEKINDIIIKDNEYKLDYFQNISIIFLLSVFILGSLFVTLLTYHQKKFMKKRKEITELFLRLDEHEIANHLNRARTFEVLLTNNTSKFSELKTLGSINFRKRGTANQNRIPKKEANMRKLNLNQILVSTLGLLLFIVLLIPFMHILVLITKNTSIIRHKLDTVNQLHTRLYHILLLAGSFYNYVRLDRESLLRNKPIKEEWESIYKSLSETQGYLVDMLISYQNEKICSEETLKNFEHLTVGNLCTAASLKDFAYLCPRFPEGLLSKGIHNLNSFTLYTLNNLKNEYDNSDRSRHFTNITLNQKDLITVDLLIATFQSYGYIYLTGALRVCSLESIDQTKENLRVILITYISVFVFVVPFILLLLLKRMEKERVDWRKLFRKIPFEIIMTNKLLKLHLAKESNLTLQL